MSRSKKKEYFIVATSFAAPFVSDTSHHFVEETSPEAALELLASEYEHPCGLYAAAVFESADAMYKEQPALARWLSNQAAGVEGDPKDGSIEKCG